MKAFDILQELIESNGEVEYRIGTKYANEVANLVNEGYVKITRVNGVAAWCILTEMGKELMMIPA